MSNEKRVVLNKVFDSIMLSSRHNLKLMDITDRVTGLESVNAKQVSILASLYT